MDSDDEGQGDGHGGKHGAWTWEEDKLLAQYQAVHGNKWSVVAQFIPGRTGQQCAQRWRHKVNPHIRKEKWSVEEDRQLAELVAEYGNRWADIAKHIPGRTDQQCMGRWRRHLDPNIRKCSWLPQEDEMLKAKYDEHGPQWSSISKFLHGRTAQQCRARWFQLCPAENAPQGPGGQRAGNNRKDRTERFKDSESIQASARLLLTQMDDLGELPLQRPPGHTRGARARLPGFGQDMFADEDSPVAHGPGSLRASGHLPGPGSPSPSYRPSERSSGATTPERGRSRRAAAVRSDAVRHRALQSPDQAGYPWGQMASPGNAAPVTTAATAAAIAALTAGNAPGQLPLSGQLDGAALQNAANIAAALMGVMSPNSGWGRQESRSRRPTRPRSVSAREPSDERKDEDMDTESPKQAAAKPAQRQRGNGQPGQDQDQLLAAMALTQMAGRDDKPGAEQHAGGKTGTPAGAAGDANAAAATDGTKSKDKAASPMRFGIRSPGRGSPAQVGATAPQPPFGLPAEADYMGTPCKGTDAWKAAEVSRRRGELHAMEGTPGNLLQTPSLPGPVAGATPPAFQPSPLDGVDTQIFTPSSRKLLMSMPEPMDTLPFDLPTGLTPQGTPQRGSKHAGTAMVRSGGAGRLSARRHRTAPPGAHAAGAAYAQDKRAALPTPLHARAGLAADGQLPDDPAAFSDMQADKPAVSRRLHFDRSDDESESQDVGDLAMDSDAVDPRAAAAVVAAQAAARLAKCSPKQQMRPPAPPSVFESPLKRQRYQASSGDEGQRPLYVPSASDPHQPPVSRPDTPRKEAAERDGAVRSEKHVAPEDGIGRTDTMATTGGTERTKRDTGHSDTSTGKSSMSAMEAAGGDRESRQKQEQLLAQNLAQKALAQVHDAVKSGQVTDSSQLKSQLHNLIDSMFGAQ